MTLLVDLFPIMFDLDSFPLMKFQILTDNPDSVGGVFAHRIKKFKGIPASWCRDTERIIVPHTTTEQNLMDVLQELWQVKQDGFDKVNGVDIDNTSIEPIEIAQFTIHGILNDSNANVRQALKNQTLSVNMVQVNREAHYQGVVVDGNPAVQVTITSPMKTNKNLSDYYDPKNPEALINKGAQCKDTTGEVSKIAGSLKDYRTKLKSWNPDSYDVAVIDTLPDEHPIIGISTRKKYYEYPLVVLKAHVDMSNLKEFGLSIQEIKKITGYLKIAPKDRKPLIDKVHSALVNYLKQHASFIQLGKRYNSQTHANNFASPSVFNLDMRLRFDRGTAVVQRDTQMLRTINKQGIFKIAKKFRDDNKIRIAVVDAIPAQDHLESRNQQLSRIVQFFKTHNLTVVRAVDPINIYESNSSELRKKLSTKLQEISELSPDIVLVYLPDEDKNRSSDDDFSLYNTVKRICIGDGVPSQVIYKSTLSKSWTDRRGKIHYSADDNLFLGILGKTGNIPYVLAQPLSYADVIVGLDVSRRQKKNNVGTINFAALSRVYTNSGALLGYRASTNMVIAGEIIPQQILETILPQSEFQGKKVVVHRDGRFVGDEVQNILDWGDSIGATFYPIEVTKSGVARLYEEKKKAIEQAPKLATFSLDDNHAYVASTPPPSGKSGSFSTSRPLKITNYSDLNLKDAIHSVMALTLLHYGSTRSTRLPVSIHASDKIAGFLSKNITPQKAVGDVPFWL